LSDLSKLQDRYTAFLDRYSLYEPRWLATAPAFEGGDYLLVFPELAEDFPEFAAALSGLPRVSVPEAPLPRLSWYPNSRVELLEAVTRVASLLDEGTPPSEIVITVCGLERLRERILQSASRLDVPVNLGMGVPLSESAPGRFFSSMLEAVESGFGVDALKPLLLTPAVPWKDYAVNSQLILEGVEHGVLGGGRSPDRRWRMLSASAAKERVEQLIRDLPAMVRAPSAAELRKRYFAFSGRFLDADRWDPEQERVLQRCLEELSSLADLERRHGFSIPDPFLFWMDRLRNERYVPAQRDYGVLVLPYRVGAGMNPLHHFVVNADNRELTVQIERLPFLSEAEREQLGKIAQANDLSAPFAAAYAVSGGQVHLSGSRLTFDGPSLPPSVFVAANAVEESEGSAVDPFELEKSVGSPLLARVLPLQTAGSEAYAQTEEQTAIDLTQTPLADQALIRELLIRQGARDNPQTLLLAPYHFESYLACPFSYLLSRPLGVGELDFEIDAGSPLVIGSLYHAALQRFFEELRDSGSIFDPAELSSYQQRIKELLDDQIVGDRGMIPEFVHEANKPLYHRVLERVLELDSGAIAGHRPVNVEQWERMHLEEWDMLLAGRVDRVTSGPSGDLTLVDYKRRSVPTKKAQNGNNAQAVGVASLSESELDQLADEISSFQIPFYLYMIESHGGNVGTACYYSLEEGKPSVVFAESGQTIPGRPAMTRDRMEEIVVLLKRRLKQVADRLRAGDYRCGSCEQCRFRGICRSRFVVR
jgi:hypothetical protein